MGSFSFSDQDVLFISVSINACYLLQMTMTRLVKWLVPCLSHRNSMGHTLLNVHQRWPGLLGRMLMEQLTLFILLVLILVNLGFVSSSILPFRENTPSEYHHLTRLILSASTGRFIVIAVGIVLSSDAISYSIDGSTGSTSGHTRNARCHFIYSLFNIVSNVIGLGYKQNLLLLGTSSFMELNTTSLVICRLIKLANRHKGRRSYLKTSLLCCAVCLFSRVLLPVLFLCLALGQETPFVMDTLPLIWFFVSAVLYFLFHLTLIYYSVKRIIKASTFSSETAEEGHSCSTDGSCPMYNYSPRLTNDIYDEILLENEKDSLDNGCELPKQSRTKLKDLNYGFLRCYDNRNLCSLVYGSEEEKINFLQKNSSKHEFIFKFITKENKNNYSPVCEKRTMQSSESDLDVEKEDCVCAKDHLTGCDALCMDYNSQCCSCLSQSFVCSEKNKCPNVLLRNDTGATPKEGCGRKTIENTTDMDVCFQKCCKYERKNNIVLESEGVYKNNMNACDMISNDDNNCTIDESDNSDDVDHVGDSFSHGNNVSQALNLGYSCASDETFTQSTCGEQCNVMSDSNSTVMFDGEPAMDPIVYQDTRHCNSLFFSHNLKNNNDDDGNDDNVNVISKHDAENKSENGGDVA